MKPSLESDQDPKPQRKLSSVEMEDIEPMTGSIFGSFQNGAEGGRLKINLIKSLMKDSKFPPVKTNI
jgi:hypothetical protein